MADTLEIARGTSLQAIEKLIAHPRHSRYNYALHALQPILTITQTLADRLGLYVQAYTLYSSVRPFGISTILGSVENGVPQLYVIEPSGVFFVSALPCTSSEYSHILS